MSDTVESAAPRMQGNRIWLRRCKRGPLRLMAGWILGGGIQSTEPVAAMHLFLSAFDDIPDPRAENTRHDLGELLVIAFVSTRRAGTGALH